MMLILIMLVLFVLGTISAFGAKNSWFGWYDFWGIFSISFYVLVVIILVGMGWIWFQTKNDIAEFKGLQETVVLMRKADNKFEKVSVIRDVAKYNSWLKSIQYWNHTIIDPAIPDEVDALKLIR